MRSQDELIKNREWDNLFIFDAARYDFFQDMYPDFLAGELLKVNNGGVAYTYDWFKLHFHGDWSHTTLYTAAPIAVREKWKKRGYNTGKHFQQVIGWQDIDFDFEEGTSRPEMLNQAVLTRWWKERKVIRYLQPHPPFVGEPSLPFTRGTGKEGRTKHKLHSGQVTVKLLKEAYKGNLKLAFEGAVELLPHLKGETVITSDHGELLGEKGRYYHSRRHPKIPCMVQVPWFRVHSRKDRKGS